MGLIRGGLVVIVSIILFLFLISGNLFYTLNKSLEYEKIQENVLPEISTTLENNLNITQDLDEKYSDIKEYCENKTLYQEKYNKTFENEFNLSCEEINLNATNSTRELTQNLIEKKFNETYYQNYDCKMFDCLKQGQPLVFISQHAKNYWKGLFIKNLWILFILLSLLILLVEKKLNALIIGGIIGILSSIPFFYFNPILNILAKPIILSEQMLTKNTNILTQITETLFRIISSSAFGVGLFVLIVSIIILIFVIPLKIWKATIGKNQPLISPEFKEKIKKWFSRDKSENKTQII
ncbi:MAG: hypothetical protein ACOCUU_02610 [Nanoarchaeota archaeon]